MGKNYFLSKGNLHAKFNNIKLTEIFKDMKSLENIDLWTSQFDNLEELKKELISRGLIRSNDDICIGTYKTIDGIKRLIPIYQRKLIFKSDLEKLGIKGKDYLSIALELKTYIYSKYNDLNFMSYLIGNYYEKYANSKRNIKAPIYENGDISILYRIINSADKSSRDEKEYAVSLKNFINNELFKCEIVFEEVVFGSNDMESVKMFKPMNKNVNVKGLHDLLCFIINYCDDINFVHGINDYPANDYEQEIIDNYDHEEFLEHRDFERPLKAYAQESGLDLSDEVALEQDDYANSFILDEQRLVKKYDGME